MIGGMKLREPKYGLVLLGLAFVLGLYALTLAQESAWFCRPYGTVEYRGDLAPDGHKVVASIGGQGLDSCFTQNGEYSLLIPKDDPVTAKKEGWAEGDIVAVKVNGFSANPKFEAFAGAQQINLYVSTLDVPPTTWGKIKALFR
jgi:hypothetical protein